MLITERQEKILDIVVREYVKTAQPVGSKFLEKKYKLGICPASIRVELQKLTDAGFISQPHTSAGRIPTDKGYRFFVDNLLTKNLALEINQKIKFDDWLKDELVDSIKFLQTTTRNLSLISSSLALAYLVDQQVSWKEGWAKVINEPEFKDERNVKGFFEMIDLFEQEMKNLDKELKPDSEITIFIGQENPFAKTKEFSIIVSKCCFSGKEQGLLALLGPKRMNYDLSINSLNYLINFLTEKNK